MSFYSILFLWLVLWFKSSLSRCTFVLLCFLIGTVKGKECDNGSKQNKYLKHGETMPSPTVSLEAIVAILLIDAKEDLDVAVFYFP